MRETVKRLIDIIVSLIGLVILAPLMLIVALIVSIDLGWPVIFSQVRAGLGGIPFAIFKFRTMDNLQDPQGNLAPDSDRTTRFGRFLRVTSIDELPQLWNVLRGDMSLVGPRPLYLHYIDYYSDRELMRLAVRPGLTGLAQVSGRDELSWDERLELDAQYVENRSILLDGRIMLETVFKVIGRRGIEGPAIIKGSLVDHRQQPSETTLWARDASQEPRQSDFEQTK